MSGEQAIDLRDSSGAGAAGDVPTALLELAGQLGRSRSGVAFIYLALETLAARYALSDAVLVLDDTLVGRQVFRLARNGLESGPPGESQGWLGRALRGDAGLFAEPPVVERATAAYVVNLASAALRLDVLAHDASHDPLTGLLNRRSYDRALADAIGRSRRYGWPFALMLIDLDNFKAVNDGFGHAAGDATLRALGGELRAVLRAGDVAARLGGDEFALIVLTAGTPESLDPLVARLNEALERSVPTSAVRFSAGVACFPDDADDAAGLQRIADERLYAAKPVV